VVLLDGASLTPPLPHTHTHSCTHAVFLLDGALLIAPCRKAHPRMNSALSKSNAFQPRSEEVALWCVCVAERERKRESERAQELGDSNTFQPHSEIVAFWCEREKER